MRDQPPAREVGDARTWYRWRQRSPDVSPDVEFLSPREAAAALGLSERTIRRAIAAGTLVAVKQGDVILIPRQALLSFAAGMGLTVPSRPPVAPLISLPRLDETVAPLPEPLSSFIGREEEVASIVDLLIDPTVRLLTLTGPGGIGKTRLATVAAAMTAEHFPDGVAFIALDTIQRPEQVVPAIAQALRLREQNGHSRLQQLQTFLLHKELLLVLDNFEQILPAAAEVTALLSVARGVKALVTSRAPLRVAGERELPVPPLTLAADQASATELLASAAGRLFVERARDNAPAFTLDEQTAPLIAAICSQLEGLPLAIELAAARVSVLPPRQLQARLERRLPLLTRGARNAPSRHRTMRDAIAWSYELLSAEEQRLFRHLSVFTGGATLEAAEWVAGASRGVEESRSRGGDGETASPSVLESLATLLDQSLLSSETGPDETPRFRSLEIIREFGLERLAETGDEAEVRTRHARYFLSRARALRPLLTVQVWREPVDQLAVEHANLEAALDWLERQEQAEDFAALVATLSDYWFTRSLYREGQNWLERALARIDQASEPDQVRLLAGLASMLIAQGQFVQAEPWLMRALALSQAAGDPLDHAKTLIFRGAQLNGVGHYAAAEVPLREAIAAAQQIDDPVLHAAVAGRALANLSVAARGQADLARAASYSDEALRLYEGKPLARARAISLMDLGAAAYAMDEYHLAAARWLEGIELAGEHGDLRQSADALSGIACVATALGRRRTALLLFGAADALRERVGAAMLWATDVAAVEERLAELRRAVDEPAVDAALGEGRKLSLAEAVVLAAVIVGDAPAAGKAGSDVAINAYAAGPTGAVNDSPDALTRREWDVLRLMAQHKSDREIADELLLSRRTINWHVSAILLKLQATSRSEAVTIARRDGLV